MKITYIHHSTFCVETEGVALVFDYFKGDSVPSCIYHGEMPKLPADMPIYVFSSHSHRDHFDPKVLEWKRQYPNIHYIFAKEIKKKLGNSLLRRMGVEESIKDSITYVKPGERYEVGGITVEALLSTDQGVAFLVTVSGKVIYHAGDLNWWRWEGEPEEFNEYQEKTYKGQIDLLSGRKVSLCGCRVHYPYASVETIWAGRGIQKPSQELKIPTKNPHDGPGGAGIGTNGLRTAAGWRELWK